MSFEYFRQLSFDLIGNSVEADKAYLMEGRLADMAAREKAESVMALVSRLQKLPVGPLHWEAVETITTKETLFFRDKSLFDTLEATVLEDLVVQKKASRSLRIWSAACSSGQEPYSVAMVLVDAFPEVRNWDVKVLASDVSSAALVRARQGVYSEFDVARGVSPDHLSRHFDKHPEGWQVRPRVRALVQFERINLAAEWPTLDTFDLVLLRNVLLYFDEHVKRTILARTRAAMATHSYLFLGAAENLLHHDDLFAPFIEGRTLGFRPV